MISVVIIIVVVVDVVISVVIIAVVVIPVVNIVVVVIVEILKSDDVVDDGFPPSPSDWISDVDELTHLEARRREVERLVAFGRMFSC